MASDGPKSGAGKAGGGPAGVGSFKQNTAANIRPAGIGGGNSNDAKNANAANGLSKAEDNATGAVGDVDASDSAVDDAVAAEEGVGHTYTGGGDGGEVANDGQDSNFFSNHKGPVATLIGIFIAVAGMIGCAQLSQPFSIVEQFRTTFNSMQTSVSNRSNVIFKYQLGKDVKNPLKTKLFSRDKFKVSNKQKSKLKQRGIDLEDIDIDGKTKTVMKFTDSSGNVRYIVPDSNDISGLKRVPGFSEMEISDFKTAFKTDADFFEAYKGGSLTWRGAIANWFESLTTKFLSDNKLTRNLFANFDQGKAQASGDALGEIKTTIAKGTEDISDGGASPRTTGEEVTDENGKTKFDSSTDDGVSQSKFSRSDLSTEAGVKAKMELDVEPKVKADNDSGGGISGAVQTATSIVCGVADTIGAISLLVTGAEALQIIHLITSYMEAIDKVKAGDGDASPINELAGALNDRTTNTHTEFEDVSVTAVDASINNSSNQTQVTNAIDTMKNNASSLQNVKKTTTQKTAMESSGMMAMFGGGKVNTNDSSVKSFNFSGSIKRILGGIGVSLFAFNTCSIAKIVANGAGAVEGIWNIGSCIVGLVGSIVTYGTTSTFCAGLVSQIVTGVAFSAALGGLISALISALVPFVAGILTRDLIANLGGEDLGNALVSGANIYMGNNHRYNGGSLSNASTYTQFALAQQEVIAEDAKYERMKRSPLDASSQYTFMGTLMRQLMGFVGTNSIMSMVTSTNSVVGSSIVAMMPTASAVNVANGLVDNYDEVCPYLASIGAVGDAYCNPYAVTDMSTIGTDPSEVIGAVSDNLEIVDEDNVTSGCTVGSGDSETECPSGFVENSDNTGGIKIKRNSDLAKYILYCDQRSSAFGIADSNIANE